jgi:hypothetical protein
VTAPSWKEFPDSKLRGTASDIGRRARIGKNRDRLMGFTARGRLVRARTPRGAARTSRVSECSRPREGTASSRCEWAQTLRRRASRAGARARGSAGAVAVCLPVSDWQRLTEINSKFCNKSVPSDE